MPCNCGRCRRCREDERFERIYRQNHGQEEHEYYATEMRRSPIGSTWPALMEAILYPFGQRFSSARKKAKNAHA